MNSDLHFPIPAAKLCLFSFGLTLLILTTFVLEEFSFYNSPITFDSLHSLLIHRNSSNFLSHLKNNSPFSRSDQTHDPNPAPITYSVPVQTNSEDKCDIYSGKWVFDPDYPLYDSRSCPFIEYGFRCEEHGRPDHNYTKLRWQPHDCDLPRFNATKMLEIVKNKRVIFVGDSVGRNQFQSMVCMLYTGVTDQKNVFDSENKRVENTRSTVVIIFKDYNMTVEYYKSHFLVKEGRRPPRSPRGIKYGLILDRMDKNAENSQGADVLVFNSAIWWDAAVLQGMYSYVEGDIANASMDPLLAYSKFLNHWSDWVDNHIDPAKTKVFFKGSAPSHFFGATWDNGGSCHNQTEPWLDETSLPPYPQRMRLVEEAIERMKTPVIFLNVTRLTAYRKDGHIAIWKRNPDNKLEYSLNHQDCTHWCLPGVPNTWNELIYFELLNQKIVC